MAMSQRKTKGLSQLSIRYALGLLQMALARKVLVLAAVQHDSNNGCLHKGCPVLTQLPLDSIQLQGEPAPQPTS